MVFFGDNLKFAVLVVQVVAAAWIDVAEPSGGRTN